MYIRKYFTHKYFNTTVPSNRKIKTTKNAKIANPWKLKCIWHTTTQWNTLAIFQSAVGAATRVLPCESNWGWNHHMTFALFTMRLDKYGTKQPDASWQWEPMHTTMLVLTASNLDFLTFVHHNLSSPECYARSYCQIHSTRPNCTGVGNLFYNIIHTFTVTTLLNAVLCLRKP